MRTCGTAPHSDDSAVESDAGDAPVEGSRQPVGLSGPDEERAHGVIHAQEAARKSHRAGDGPSAQADRTRRRELSGLRVLHAAPHVPDLLVSPATLRRNRPTWTRGRWPNLAGHGDVNITKRCVHPQEQIIRVAMDLARGWAYWATLTREKTASGSQPLEAENFSGAPGGTRTPGLLVRSHCRTWNQHPAALLRICKLP
jgi:hypothetical protein